MMENTIIENSESQTIPKPPQWNFKKANWQSYQNLCLTALIPETDANQEEPIIHSINTIIAIANKTILITQQTMIHRGVQGHDKQVSSNPQEIQNKHLIRKFN